VTDTCARCGHDEDSHAFADSTGPCLERRDDYTGAEWFCTCPAYVAPTDDRHPLERAFPTVNLRADDTAPPPVNDYEGWTETAFLPSVKYAVVWDEDRDGWAVLTLDDRGEFS